ncbi:MAG: hypothetical protein ACHRXM_20020 [Isosphaerales bacterium]
MTAEQESSLATTRRGQLWRRYLPGIGGVAVVAGTCVAWAIINFGSLRHAWLYAGGARVTIEPKAVTVQEGKEGDSREAVFLIRNLTDKAVGVVGVTTACTCVSSERLPVVLPPKGTKELRVALQLVKSPTGKTVQSVVYHTDHPAAPSLAVTVTGRVTEP